METEIDNVEHNVEETNYFLDTGKILFNYTQNNIHDKGKNKKVNEVRIWYQEKIVLIY